MAKKNPNNQSGGSIDKGEKNASNQSGGTFEAEATVAKQETYAGLSREQLEQLIVQNARLLNHVIGQQPAEKEPEETHEVINNVVMQVFLNVTDQRVVGGIRSIELSNKGAKSRVTTAEANEIAERYASHIDRGWISIPGIAESPKAIPNMDEFLNHLSLATVEQTIEAIDDVSVLYEIYHAIESRRFTNVGPDGKELTEAGALGQPVKVMRELPVSPTLLTAEIIAQRKIMKISGVKAAMD